MFNSAPRAATILRLDTDAMPGKRKPRQLEAETFLHGMTVMELARRAGVTPHVVRYYARIGLLQPGRGQENNYQLFSQRDLIRLRFARRAQDLGFRLSEIARILEKASQGHSPCPQVRDIIHHRIEENRRRIDEMIALQERMEHALESWEQLPDGLPDGHTLCHLIESSSED